MKPYLLTEIVGGAKMTSHYRGCVCNWLSTPSGSEKGVLGLPQKVLDSTHEVLNVMHNNQL